MKFPFEDEITQGDVRTDWEKVLPGLLVIKQPGSVRWRPEDLYAMCRYGDATLYLFEGGFAIVGIIRNSYTLERELHFYAVYSERQDSCIRFLPFFEALAKREGITTMTTQSTHQAFEKYGWELDFYNFKRGVT